MTRVRFVESAARQILDEVPDERVYHNESHAECVVAEARRLGELRGLSQQDLELLVSAAWFHDCGYATGPSEGHEKRSVSMIDEHLASVFDEEERERIKVAIMATKWPQEPTTELGRILADADVHTLGTEKSDAVRKRVFEELKLTEYPQLEWDDFLDARIDLFEEYVFHTEEAREEYQEMFEANLEARNV